MYKRIPRDKRRFLMPRFRTFMVSMFIIAVHFLGASTIQAQWIDNGVPVCTATDMQSDLRIASDGAGGAIITWEDYRTGGYDVYAQRIDPNGYPLWTVNGVAVSTWLGSQSEPQIVSDGSGGAVIAWRDFRNGNWDVYAQRIDANGSVLWSVGGVAVCTATGNIYDLQICSDGAGGAVIAWRDYRSDDYDIYAQRINANGDDIWTTDGVGVCTVSGSQIYPDIAHVGYGTVIIVWQDIRGVDSDIYAQGLSAQGLKRWTTSGVPVCTETGNQENPSLLPDGTHGAIITWHDFRSGSYSDIYAQRLDVDGAEQWTASGVPICMASENQRYPCIASDGSGGAIIAWTDTRSIDNNLYAQRIDPSGTALWTVDGIPICTATGVQEDIKIVSDGVEGAVMTWEDYRSFDGYPDIYAQRVDAGGDVQWITDGVAVCTMGLLQDLPQLVSDGAGGAIITWRDQRTLDLDIYAHEIERDGQLGYPAPDISSVRDIPGDQGGSVYLYWHASRLDIVQNNQISHYSIWRSLNEETALTLIHTGKARLVLTIESVDPGITMPSIRREQLGGATYFWEFVTTQDAQYLASYAKAVPTLFDSTAASSEFHYFQVIAHTRDSQVFYTSAPDSGYSVDNLAPCPPASLTGEQSFSPEGLTITWAPNTEADLDCYAIYRGLAEDFVPGPGNLIASPCDIVYFDSDWRWDSGYYYKVAAVDVHGNESQYALLGPTDVTGDETPDVPLANFLAQNFPNPFNPMTTISFGLNKPGHVSISIYDASGRLVRTLVNERRTANRYDELWAGNDDGGRPAASGVYFYRLVAGDFLETKKMVLLR